ncbi:MAG TPA: glutathione S-transferase C-terminal domain-containing protein [Actinoallomurus sp.]|nr:glutathione S-transferase C-terminal domain-containing protein [Actinoallomurus sp.]
MTSIVTREMKDGRFVRQVNRFTGVIGSDEFPAEAGRYRLYASLACPWAHRSLIVRRLLGLEEMIGVTIVDPIRDERGWRFTLSPDDRDPVTGAHFLAELYTASDPSYEGRHTVPCIWDTETKRLVTNDYPQITLTFESEAFAPFHRQGAPDLYPRELRAEIDELNDEVFHHVNNGVYKAGMATTQEAYEEPFDALFVTLDRLEARLEGHEFLVGDRLTEADVRLYPTLARFDAVYYGHFKCNLRRVIDYPRLWAYARRLYAIPAFGETTDFDHIKRHYYETHRHLNPSGIVPKGPDISWV